jgi:hypothetical protein
MACRDDITAFALPHPDQVVPKLVKSPGNTREVAVFGSAYWAKEKDSYITFSLAIVNTSDSEIHVYPENRVGFLQCHIWSAYSGPFGLVATKAAIDYDVAKCKLSPGSACILSGKEPNIVGEGTEEIQIDLELRWESNGKTSITKKTMYFAAPGSSSE